MHLFDLQQPFFIPLWRRLAVVLLSSIWCLVEFAHGAVFWGVIFAGLAVFSSWQFFFDNWPENSAGEPRIPAEQDHHHDD